MGTSDFFCFNNSTWGGEGIKMERRCQQDLLCGRNEFNNIYNLIPISENQNEVKHSGVEPWEVLLFVWPVSNDTVVKLTLKGSWNYQILTNPWCVYFAIFCSLFCLSGIALLGKQDHQSAYFGVCFLHHFYICNHIALAVPWNIDSTYINWLYNVELNCYNTGRQTQGWAMTPVQPETLQLPASGSGFLGINVSLAG